MSKEEIFRDNSENNRNGLTTRLQQIVEILYKNNGQFSKGLPSEQNFQQMLTHCYNCYDQLDFIVMDYSRNAVLYLDPKNIAEHMHRIMRATKYLFSNIRHWVESYSLDIVKKFYEERTYFPYESTQQPRCSSCNRYVEQIVLKEAREEILGCYDVRQLFQEELRQAKEEEHSQKPLTTKETTEYVGSVNFLTKIIKEMQESAHEYSRLTENIEKQDNNEQIALRYLQDLLSTMHRRIGEKCIYRLKRVVKNWEKLQKNQPQNTYKKPLFKIKQIITENYVPNGNNDRKNQTTSISNGIVKKLKEENQQLQVEYNTLNSTFINTKNSLAFLEKREETQKKEIQRLNDLLSQNILEINLLPKQRKDLRKKTIKDQGGLTINSSKLTANINTNTKTKAFAITQNASKYSKFKVIRMSRQSEILSNGSNKTVDLACGQFLGQRTQMEQNESFNELYPTVDVGTQWEEQQISERTGKMKPKLSRNSKTGKSNNREKSPIYQVSKIDEQDELKPLKQNSFSKDKNLSKNGLETYSKSRSNLRQDHKISLQETKQSRKEGKTIKKLLENHQQRISLAQLGEIKEQTTNQKISVKVLEGDPSAQKISHQKINIYGSNAKQRQLKPINFQNKGFNIKDLPDTANQNKFGQQIKKIMNMRTATEGNQVKRKVLKVRNTIFKPQHLELFGGVSESYTYEHSNDTLSNIQQTSKGYFSQLKNYLINLRSFKNHFYDNIVLFMKSPFTFIDKDEMETKLVGDKELTSCIKKFIGLHQRKCQKIPCQHLQYFDQVIGLTHFQ